MLMQIFHFNFSFFTKQINPKTKILNYIFTPIESMQRLLVLILKRKRKIYLSKRKTLSLIKTLSIHQNEIRFKNKRFVLFVKKKTYRKQSEHRYLKSYETNKVINSSSLCLDLWLIFSQFFNNKYKNNLLTIYEEHKSKTTFLSS